MWQYNDTPNSDELYHYGVLGMKWGRRKAIGTAKKLGKVNASIKAVKKSSLRVANNHKNKADFYKKYAYETRGTKKAETLSRQQQLALNRAAKAKKIGESYVKAS